MDQLIYARWLGVAARLALTVLIASFGVYVIGVPEPLVSVGALPELWRLPAHEFIAATGAPTGWGWLVLLGKSDYLNMAGVALLGAVSIVCYTRITVYYARRGETGLVWLALAQVLVLLAAASGLATGMH
jgi:hypothetical protein